MNLASSKLSSDYRYIFGLEINACTSNSNSQSDSASLSASDMLADSDADGSYNARILPHLPCLDDSDWAVRARALRTLGMLEPAILALGPVATGSSWVVQVPAPSACEAPCAVLVCAPVSSERPRPCARRGGMGSDP